jgi:hypothetical protein
MDVFIFLTASMIFFLFFGDGFAVPSFLGILLSYSLTHILSPSYHILFPISHSLHPTSYVPFPTYQKLLARTLQGGMGSLLRMSKELGQHRREGDTNGSIGHGTMSETTLL